MALLDRTLVRFLPAVPRQVVRRIADRYIAGEELEDALATVARLNEDGRSATIDVLGEEVAKPYEAREIVDAYVRVLDAVQERGLDSNVSIKPTAFGLKLGYRLCKRNVQTLVSAAAERGNFVRIDMEDSTTTDQTLRMYRELRAAGFDNVGVVLQARLRRTLDDIAALADLSPNVRICKGIYVEPWKIAYTDFDEIRLNFVRCVEELGKSASYLGIATHDEFLVAESKRVETDRYEFQMLLGVRESLGDEIVRAGHRLRIYVPFGRRWYEYSLRRLQENPRIAGYVAADTLGRMLGRNGAG